MRCGVILANVGGLGDVHTLIGLAQEAEAAGWEAVLLWDSVWSPDWDAEAEGDPARRAVADPWIALAAMAEATTRIRLGPMVTPPARRRPWKLARETVTLDHLSEGRLVLPVGLGAPDDGAFSSVGEPTDRRTRAERLDEGLAILTGLWSGEPFTFAGRHYRVEEMTFLPRPCQAPRIPIWVVAGWPSERSMARALRYDGVIVSKLGDPGTSQEGGEVHGLTGSDLRELARYVRDRRPLDGFDIAVQGRSDGVAPGSPDGPLAMAEAGVTWWLEDPWPLLTHGTDGLARTRQRIQAGPTATG